MFADARFKLARACGFLAGTVAESNHLYYGAAYKHGYLRRRRRPRGQATPALAAPSSCARALPNRAVTRYTLSNLAACYLVQVCWSLLAATVTGERIPGSLGRGTALGKSCLLPAFPVRSAALALPGRSRAAVPHVAEASRFGCFAPRPIAFGQVPKPPSDTDAAYFKYRHAVWSFSLRGRE